MTTSRPSLFRTILCPVDFSMPSRRALQHAALLASRSSSRLIVIYVNDPLLVAAAAAAYDPKVVAASLRRELRRFVERAVARYTPRVGSLVTEVAVGKPDREIERATARFGCDLIVMGSHGLTGPSKMMLGSTTHRILRRSTVPVLAVPPGTPGRPRTLSRRWPGKWILAPIDLGRRDRTDAGAAALIARDFGTKLLLLHVVKPLTALPWIELDVDRRNRQQLRQAEAKLESLRTGINHTAVECRVRAGKPGRQIALEVKEQHVGLVVMTRRRRQGLFGPHQGSISYQVLCDAGIPVLALPVDTIWIRRAASPKTKRPAA